MIENSHAQGETEPYAPGMPQSRDMPTLPDDSLAGGPPTADTGPGGTVHDAPIARPSTPRPRSPESETAPLARGANPHGTGADKPSHRNMRTHDHPMLRVSLDTLHTLAEIEEEAHEASDVDVALRRMLTRALPLLPSARGLAIYVPDGSSAATNDSMALIATTETVTDAGTPGGVGMERLAGGILDPLAQSHGGLVRDDVWYESVGGDRAGRGVLAVRLNGRSSGDLTLGEEEQAIIRLVRVSLGDLLTRREHQARNERIVAELAEARRDLETMAASNEEQARAFDQFLSLAAHELRSPLTSVKGYGQLLLRQAGKLNLPERVVRSAEAIVQQAERLAEMIDELHDAARIRRGRLELAHEPVDLVAVTERAITRLQHEYPRREIEFTREVDAAGGTWDGPRVAQCVRALIDNALRFSPEAGAIRIDLHTETNAGHIEAILSVRDAGIGIRPEEREQIYAFLYRSPTAEQRNLAGLGLGLFVAQHTARMLGGRLWLVWSSPEDEVGSPSGTEFRLALPLTPDSEDQAHS